MVTKSLSKTQLTKAVAVIVVSLFLLSCKKSKDADLSIDNPKSSMLELSPAEYVSVAYDNPKELTLEEVKQLIQEYPLKSKPNTKGSDIFHYDISDKYYLNKDGDMESASSSITTKGSNEDKIPVYKVSLSGNGSTGSALVCADERAPLVLAYMPLNDLKSEILRENLMYESSMKFVVNRITFINHLRDSLRVKTLNKLHGHIGKLPDHNISAFLKDKIKVRSNPATKSPVESYLPSQVISQVGPLATTIWDQEGVSNQLIGAADGCTNAPAGCLVIAGAQVLARLEPVLPIVVGTRPSGPLFPIVGPTLPVYQNVNWPYLKQSSFIGFNDPEDKRVMFSRMMRDIFYNTGTTPNCHGSGTQMQKMIDYLRRYISIDDKAGFNVQQIKNSLDNSNVVIGAGSRISGTEKIRHAWVIDGYAICEKISGSTPGDLVHQYDLYLHANMGWGGMESGWFLVGADWNLSFDVFYGERQYGLGLEMAINARKK